MPLSDCTLTDGVTASRNGVSWPRLACSIASRPTSVFVTGVRSSARTACTTIDSSSRIGPGVGVGAGAAGEGVVGAGAWVARATSWAAAPLATATAVIAPATSAAVPSVRSASLLPESRLVRPLMIASSPRACGGIEAGHLGCRSTWSG